MRQVEVFKVPADASQGVDHPASHRTVSTPKPTAKPAGNGVVAKPTPKKPMAASKGADVKAPAGVGGNGHDRRRKDDDFEEF